MIKPKFEIKDLLYLIVIGIAAYFLFQMNAKLSGNKKALKMLDSRLEIQKEVNEKKIDSLGLAVSKLKLASAEDMQAAEDIQAEKDKLKNEAYENAPYRINDADSLAGLITRRAKAKR